MRITYWIAPERRIILLTAFRKTRQREPAEIARAVRAWAHCVGQEHTVDEG
ncbi:DNA-binding protein [Streptomyces showdoensis]|uniref:DNA-binding protein n=1 Tax=Streptomyces showdoensis TaxID=68268 RepID=UPI00268967E4